MPSPRVTAVVVTYNSVDFIGSALSSLREPYDEGLVECVVVDNASQDGTTDCVRRGFPWATLIENDKNLGYGRGCNTGARHAKFPYILILNPDLCLPKDGIQRMLDFMDAHPQAGIVAPAIIEDGQRNQHAGGLTTAMRLIASSLRLTNPEHGIRPTEPGGSPFQTDFVCGAAMMMRRSDFERLDGFDSRFFLYFEETDLCRRFIQEGMELWVVNAAVAEHVGGASAKNTEMEFREGVLVQHYFESRFYYLRKHDGIILAVAVEFMELLCNVARGLVRRIQGLPHQPLRVPNLRSPKKVNTTSSL